MKGLKLSSSSSLEESNGSCIKMCSQVDLLSRTWHGGNRSTTIQKVERSKLRQALGQAPQKDVSIHSFKGQKWIPIVKNKVVIHPTGVVEDLLMSSSSSIVSELSDDDNTLINDRVGMEAKVPRNCVKEYHEGPHKSSSARRLYNALTANSSLDNNTECANFSVLPLIDSEATGLAKFVDIIQYNAAPLAMYLIVCMWYFRVMMDGSE